MAWAHGSVRFFIAATTSTTLALGLAVACAKGGTTIDETTSDLDEGGGGSVSTAGGLGGTPTTTTGGMGGMGGDGGTELPCSEDPCKVTAPQCGCPSGEKCTVVSGDRDCITAGSATEGAACTNDTDCEAGTMCLTVGGVRTCHAFCNNDPECTPPGGLCAIDLAFSNGNEKVCTENCDPVTNAGCGVAGSKCEPLLDTTMTYWYTACTATGAGTQGAPCTSFDDCAPGFGCVTINSVTACRQWCNSAAPSCGANCLTNFTPPIAIGSITYGACQ